MRSGGELLNDTSTTATATGDSNSIGGSSYESYSFAAGSPAGLQSSQSLPSKPLQTTYLLPQRAVFLTGYHKMQLHQGLGEVVRGEKRLKAMGCHRSLGLHDDRKPYADTQTAKNIIGILNR
jgi:hypothetical protein